MTRETLARRKFLAGSAIGAATLLLSEEASAAVKGKQTFTILHTNDLHSNFLGMSPASDYSPFTLNDDKTRGGFARLAALIATRKAAREDQGPVLILDGGDYSMGTAFGAAIRETGAELQLMSRMGYDATTLGNHDFDLGPDRLSKSIEVAVKAGRMPAVVASNSDFSAEDAKLTDLQRLAKDGVIRRHVVIERGGLRFGIFGLIGKEAVFYTAGAGAVTFPDAIDTPRSSTPDLLPPRGSLDKGSLATVGEKGAIREIKEWQAIMDYLRSLPAKNPGGLPTIPVDERAAEVRAIRVG